jgi:hypothetical protein
MSRPYARARKTPGSQQPAQSATDWRQTYLSTLSNNCGQKTAAARAARVTLRTVQRHRANDPEFKKAEADALQIAMEVVESEAIRRAVEGVDRSYRYTDKNGTIHEHVGREYSDRILLRYLVKLETGSWSDKRVLGHQGAGITFKTRAERLAALEKMHAAMQEQPAVTALNEQRKSQKPTALNKNAWAPSGVSEIQRAEPGG